MANKNIINCNLRTYLKLIAYVKTTTSIAFLFKFAFASDIALIIIKCVCGIIIYLCKVWK